MAETKDIIERIDQLKLYIEVDAPMNDHPGAILDAARAEILSLRQQPRDLHGAVFLAVQGREKELVNGEPTGRWLISQKDMEALYSIAFHGGKEQARQADMAAREADPVLEDLAKAITVFRVADPSTFDAVTIKDLLSTLNGAYKRIQQLGTLERQGQGRVISESEMRKLREVNTNKLAVAAKLLGEQYVSPLLAAAEIIEDLRVTP